MKKYIKFKVTNIIKWMNFHADQKPIDGTVMKSIIPYSLTGLYIKQFY
jgi:hypothetical protein